MLKRRHLLGLVLVAALVLASSAAKDEDDDDDDDEKATDGASDAWSNKECTITNAAAPKYRLYLNAVRKGMRLSYKRDAAKAATWRVQPVVVGGKTYFQLYNLLYKAWLTDSKKYAFGNYRDFKQSASEQVLWQIEPPTPGLPVTLTTKSGKFLSKPSQLHKKLVGFSDEASNEWIFNCT